MDATSTYLVTTIKQKLRDIILGGHWGQTAQKDFLLILLFSHGPQALQHKENIEFMKVSPATRICKVVSGEGFVKAL